MDVCLLSKCLVVIIFSYILFKFFMCLLYFWLCWCFVAGLSVVVGWRTTLQLWCTGLSLWWLLLLWGTGCTVLRLQQLWCTALVTSRHAESSWTRDQTHVSCIGRQILNHWTTREALCSFSIKFKMIAGIKRLCLALHKFSFLLTASNFCFNPQQN